jgi:hypothetical protein
MKLGRGFGGLRGKRTVFYGTLTTPEDIGYSSKTSNLELIDSQMNAVVLNLPSYMITPDSSRHYSVNYCHNYR